MAGYSPNRPPAVPPQMVGVSSVPAYGRQPHGYTQQEARPPTLSSRPANSGYASPNLRSETPSHDQNERLQQPNRSRAPPQRPPKPVALSRTDNMQQQQIQSDSKELTFGKDDIIIAVMGVTGAGKSTFISLLSNEEIEIGHGLQSCTSSVGVYYFMLQGVRVWLIDTPGFDDTNRSDAEVLKDVAFWLAAAYTRETRLAGIIYLHRITDVRMLGSAKRNLRMFKQLCGTDNLNSVILATTHWSDKEGKRVPEEVGRQRVQELMGTSDFWGEMIDRGSRVERHDGTEESARRIVSNLVDRRIRVILDIQKDLIDRHMSLFDTNAGQALQAELIEERKRSEAKLADLKEDMEFAIEENNVKWQKDIENDRAKFEAEIKKGFAETEDLKTNMKKMAEEKEARIRAMEAKMDVERKRFEEEIKASTGAIEAFKAEQREKELKYQQEKREYDARVAQQAQEHREKLAAEERRIRAETDTQRRKDIERERQILRERYEGEQATAKAAAEERRKDWLRQQAEYQRREARAEDERAATQARLEELDLKSRKRSIWNPKRWIGDKYRDY